MAERAINTFAESTLQHIQEFEQSTLQRERERVLDVLTNHYDFDEGELERLLYPSSANDKES